MIPARSVTQAGHSDPQYENLEPQSDVSELEFIHWRW